MSADQDDEEEGDDEWSELWDARLAAIEKVLGPSDDSVIHGMIPFQFGQEMGGQADIVMFSKHVDGTVYVTADLIGNEEQQTNSMGNYELMICRRKEGEEDDEWGSWIIGSLAHYTIGEPIEPGETMGLGEGVPEGATVEAFLFVDYGRFEVLGKPAGLLLCLALTGAEGEYAMEHGPDAIIEKLKAAKIYPFSDTHRKSVV
jgi:suppressor of fused protein SUFU